MSTNFPPQVSQPVQVPILPGALLVKSEVVAPKDVVPDSSKQNSQEIKNPPGTIFGKQEPIIAKTTPLSLFSSPIICNSSGSSFLFFSLHF